MHLQIRLLFPVLTPITVIVPLSPCVWKHCWQVHCTAIQQCSYDTHQCVFKITSVAPVANHVNKVSDHVQEASTLLSALAAALSNCHLPWPAFLPVHDPLRDAHWGIAAAGLATVHYDSDSIHLSKNPTHLQQVRACLHISAGFHRHAAGYVPSLIVFCSLLCIRLFVALFGASCYVAYAMAPYMS